MIFQTFVFFRKHENLDFHQNHDELVFVVKNELVESYTEIITRVMEESAEKFLMPYGVHAEVSPAIGDVWLKD